jgi:hypothetical protein
VTNEAQNPPAIPEQMQIWMQLESVFMPSATRQRHTLYEGKGGSARFAHYTTAEAALKIIDSKRMWMRNTTCMSDYREVHHGYEILLKFFSDKPKRAGGLVKKCVNEIRRRPSRYLASLALRRRT